MPKYRKKPVVIESVRFNGANHSEVCDFFASNPHAHYDADGASTDLAPALTEGGWVEITTLEGTMRADVGDWIIKGVKGEFYPCKSDIFEATYEPVDG